MTEISNTDFSRSLPQAPTFFEQQTSRDHDAVLTVINTLERAVNTSNGDLFGSVLSEDVIWGSPKGQIVLGLDQLNPIHGRLAANSQQYGHSSQFTLEALGFIGPDTACVSVRRTGLNEHGLPSSLFQGQNEWSTVSAQAILHKPRQTRESPNRLQRDCVRTVAETLPSDSLSPL